MSRREQHAVSIARRLDLREREILRALFGYEVLLTHQLRVLFFSSLRRCQDVMKNLKDLRLVERDTPSGVGVGRGHSMWTLTEDGVRVAAVLLGRARSQIEWMPRHSFHAADRHLDHTLGVNRFFVSLVEASVFHAAHGLEKWVPAKQVESRNNWITHDGFGRYQHPGGACDFYFEYERGTEWRDQLVRELRGYLLMAIKWTEEGAQQFPNVLVVVPSEKREAAFDRALLAAVESLEIGAKTAVALPFFITSEELLADEGVFGKVWRRFVPAPPDRPLASFLLSERLSLVELPSHKMGPFDLDRCFGRRWTDPGRDRDCTGRRVLPRFLRVSRRAPVRKRLARPEVGATRRADPGTRPRASDRELNHAGESVTSRSGVSQVRDNLAGSDESLRTLAAALVELGIQILGDDKEEEIAV